VLGSDVLLGSHDLRQLLLERISFVYLRRSQVLKFPLFPDVPDLLSQFDNVSHAFRRELPWDDTLVSCPGEEDQTIMEADGSQESMNFRPERACGLELPETDTRPSALQVGGLVHPVEVDLAMVEGDGDREEESPAVEHVWVGDGDLDGKHLVRLSGIIRKMKLGSKQGGFPFAPLRAVGVVKSRSQDNWIRLVVAQNGLQFLIRCDEHFSQG